MIRRGLLAALVLVLGVCVALAVRSHRRHSAQESAAPQVNAAKPAELERVTAEKLFDSYTAGAASADPIYRSKRFTVVGNVASVRADAGAAQVVLGSDLQPVIATGLNRESAASLIPGAAIEVDCLVTGVIVGMPTIDCGPNGVPRSVTQERK